jgi:RND family efflux transporter MFP subunit
MAGERMTRAWHAFAIVGIAVIALAGCQKQKAASEPPPRPIKTFVVTEAVGGAIRRYTGRSEASETTALSFPVSGTIEDILVGVGDKVEQGDIVAKLDPEPFQLDVQAAKAEVEKAEADLVANQGDLERNQTLFAKGWVSQAAIEKLQASYNAAASTLEYARSRLAVAERDLANATLRAPYAGTIASRAVERFQDVAAAQVIVELNSTDGLLVAFAVPETAINRISLGQPVSVVFSTLGPRELEGRITEIESAASSGNAYTVKASILDPPAELRPGMTAEVAVADPVQGPDAGYLVPLSAVAPGDANDTATVFKYDAAEGVVRQIPIRPADAARGNLVIVLEGVEPGDILASAGVSFLMDGQPVSLLTE